jgi:hypothetical protein
MKNYFFAILIGIALIISACAKSDQQLMLSIDNVRIGIKNNIASLTKVEKFKDSTGYRYAYFKEKDLQLITVYFKDQNIDKNVEWYFSNGKLIYSEQTWINTELGQIVDNEKYYLDDNRLIAWVKTDKSLVDKTSHEFIEVDSKLPVYGEKLQKDNN